MFLPIFLLRIRRCIAHNAFSRQAFFGADLGIWRMPNAQIGTREVFTARWGVRLQTFCFAAKNLTKLS